MSSSLQHSRVWAIFVFLLAAPAAPAWACSCAPAGSNPPCQAAWSASAVFTGTVIDITDVPPIPAPADGDSMRGRQMAIGPGSFMPSHQRIVRIQPEEVLTGIQPGLKEVEIVTGMGGGDCGYDFHPGQDYIVYAHKDSDGRLETGICSRTRQLVDAADDLAYLRAVAAAPPTGEIRIVRMLRGMPGISGVRASIEGGGRQYTVFTDAAGEATLSGLPPGEYKIRAELNGYLPADRTVQLHAKGCAEVPLFMLVDRRIQGRVLTKDGRPAANIIVEARGTKENFGESAKTDEEGRYELRRFRSGGYYLGINLQQPPTLEIPYTRWFYPGTEDPAKAAVIYFSDEAEIRHYDLMLPDLQGERVVQGRVLWPDGRPAAGARLSVLDAHWLWRGFISQATTDAAGFFALPGLLDGTHYRLHAVSFTSPYRIVSADPVDLQPGKTPVDLQLILVRPGDSIAADQRKGIEQFRNKQ